MPSNKPQTRAAGRPAPKERAAALRASAGLDSLEADATALRSARASVLPGPEASPPSGRCECLPDPRAIAETFAVAGLPMSELMAVHGAASAFADLGCAITCQPKCTVEQNGLLVGLTPAGHFAQWVTDVVSWLMERIQAEARQRQPADQDEARARLQILAQEAVSTAEPDEMRAFAADLVAQADRLEAWRTARG